MTLISLFVVLVFASLTSNIIQAKLQQRGLRRMWLDLIGKDKDDGQSR